MLAGAGCNDEAGLNVVTVGRGGHDLAAPAQAAGLSPARWARGRRGSPDGGLAAALPTGWPWWPIHNAGPRWLLRCRPRLTWQTLARSVSSLAQPSPPVSGQSSPT